MAITVTCDACGKIGRVRDEAAGKRLRCTECGEAVLVPAQDQWEADDPDAEFSAASLPASRQRPERGSPRRGRKGASRSHSGIPEKAKEAILGLAVAGFLWLVFGGMGVYLMQTDDLDALGRGITYYLLSLAVGGFICSALLWQRVRAAKYLAMVISLFYIIFFPLGTIAGVIIYRGLLSEDLDDYLAGA